MRLPPYNNLRHFRKGISMISQWTGSEYREMEKVFIGVLCGLHANTPAVLTAARAVLDFIYLAHYPSHSTTSLVQMKTALDDFHEHKQVFLDIGAQTEGRAHFNIPKIHAMQHYVPGIMDFGTCDGTNTEISERLHIDYAKLGYRASNRKDYLAQMVKWLTRRDKMAQLDRYVAWMDQLSHGPRLSEDSGLVAARALYPDEYPAVQESGEAAEEEEEGDVSVSRRRNHEPLMMRAMDEMATLSSLMTTPDQDPPSESMTDVESGADLADAVSC